MSTLKSLDIKATTSNPWSEWRRRRSRWLRSLGLMTLQDHEDIREEERNEINVNFEDHKTAEEVFEYINTSMRDELKYVPFSEVQELSQLVARHEKAGTTLQKENEALKAELKEVNKNYDRTVLDLENARKRLHDQRIEIEELQATLGLRRGGKVGT